MAHLNTLLALASAWLLQAVTLTVAVRLKQSPINSYLRDTSDPDVIPIADTSNGPLKVDIQLSLNKIIQVANDFNEIEVVLWQGMSWNNPALAWDVKREGFNQTDVSLPSKYLWVPDITIYNAISSTEVLSPSLAHVSSGGWVYFSPSVRVRISCDLENVTSTNGANCTIKVGSWTRSGNVMSISNPGADFDMSNYVPIPNYEVLSTSSNKNSKTYPCCPNEVYEDIDFQFVIRRRGQAVPSSQ